MRKAARRGWNSWWIRYYTLRLAKCQADAQERAAKLAELDAMSARLAPTVPPVSQITLTVVPVGFPVESYGAKVAYGARKARGGCIGGAQSSANIAKTADRRVIRGLASRGW